VRVGLGLRRLLDEGGYHGVSVNFQAFDRPDRPANTMPFLEISKAMARGVGYAGEGDVLTAALVGALARAFGAVTFTEVFCADWAGGTLFLSHMGEISPAVAGDTPRVIAKPFRFGGALDPAVLTCAVKPGPAAFVNLAPGPDDSFSLLVAPVAVMAETAALEPAMRDVVRAWVRPRCGVAEFLEAYSRAGGTHHSALVLGDRAEAVAAFGRMLGIEVRVIGG
jgi:L-arabinose isomerase